MAGQPKRRAKERAELLREQTETLTSNGNKFAVTAVDWDKFDALCASFVPLKTIANFWGVTTDWLEAQVQAKWGVPLQRYYEVRRAVGEVALYRAQMKSATINGNLSAQTFLGKQYLGQSNSPTSAEDNAPLPWVDDEPPPAAVRNEGQGSDDGAEL